MKRYALFLIPLGVLLVAGLTLLGFARSEPDERPAVRAEDVPLPARFRQNQPRHWRYLVMPQR